MKNRLWIALLLAALATPLFAAKPAETPALYLVFEIDQKDDVTLVSQKDVKIDGLTSDADDPLADLRPDDGRGGDAIAVRLLDSSGAVKFRKALRVERVVRSEYASVDGAMISKIVPLPRAAFVVRVPAEGADTIEIEHKKSKKIKRFKTSETKKKVTSTAMGGALQTNSLGVLVNGIPSNRIDILVMGDGYTAAQENQFYSDVTNFATNFLTLSPYSEYRKFFNVLALFVPSQQSGADHPVCSETDPLAPSFVNTAFDATYCSGGAVQRALVVNNTKVLQYADAEPAHDAIVVLVNDPTYGGTGGGISVSSIHPAVVDVMRHELGHSFSLLGDEYVDAATAASWGPCSDLAGATDPPCQPNITNQLSRSSIKWSPWILSSTPIPTPDNNTGVGLYQGARYTNSYYRPRFDCLMNHLGQPFCEVCREQFVVRLYTGWGGIPSGGVSQIDDALSSPQLTADLRQYTNTSRLFSSNVVTLTGAPQTIEWLVDGTVAATGTSSYSYSPAAAGNHLLVLRVTDPASFVTASRHAAHMVSEVTWNVTAANAVAPANVVATAAPTNVTVTWTPAPGATHYRVFRNSGSGFVRQQPDTTTTATAYFDPYVTAGTAYVYKMQGLDSNDAASPDSAVDLATVFTATDETLTSTTAIKAVHVTELRAAIDVARNVAGLGPAVYSRTVASGNAIRASDITEMRTAANAARVALGMPAFVFSDASLSGVAIQTRHVTELRNAIR